MDFSWFIFRFLCIICCVIAVTSYNIDYQPLNEERDERAVTEWRFRRNYLFNFPYLFRSHIRNNRLLNHQTNDNNQIDEIKLNSKKFIIPELFHLQSESRNK